MKFKIRMPYAAGFARLGKKPSGGIFGFTLLPKLIGTKSGWFVYWLCFRIKL